MKKIVLLFLLILLSIAQGCAVRERGEILRDEAPFSAKAQYDMRAALVAKPTIENEKLYLVLLDSYVFYNGSDIYTALAEKLKKVFSSVNVVVENTMNVNDYDILLYPKITGGINSKRGSFLSNIFEPTFGIEIKGTDPRNNEHFNLSYKDSIESKIGLSGVRGAFTIFEEDFNKIFHSVSDKLVAGLLEDKNLSQYAMMLKNSKQTPPTYATSPAEGRREAESRAFTSDVDMLPESRNKPNDNAYAIVIGIEHYRQKLPAADFAVNDAQAVSQYLTKVMGYPEENVVTLLDNKASKSDLEKYFEKWLPDNVEKGGKIFIYYSGHGAPNPAEGNAFLVPYDGDPTFIEQTGYPVKRLYEALDKISAVKKVVVLDSCFSGAGGRSVIAKGARPIVLKMENALMPRQDMLVLSASSGDQISSTYEEKSHGLFTYFFLKGIKAAVEENKNIAAGELYEYLKPKVERVSRKVYSNEQSPMLITPVSSLRDMKLIQ